MGLFNRNLSPQQFDVVRVDRRDLSLKPLSTRLGQNEAQAQAAWHNRRLGSEHYADGDRAVKGAEIYAVDAVPRLPRRQRMY